MSAQSAERIWYGFRERFSIVKECVPLFESTGNGTIVTRTKGKAPSTRPVLSRSAEMGAIILHKATKLFLLFAIINSQLPYFRKAIHK